MNTKQIADFKKVATWVENLRADLNKNTIPGINQFRKLAGWYDLIKVATPDSDFEQSFFQLAYEKLQDKLNNLLPYLVGFEIVNKSDDGTKALGVFGFKSNNNQIIYVPAFFVNGTVKGIDIMYSKNNEQFYPLNEDFAEMFLKDDATGIGDASHESRKQIAQGTQPTDMRDLVRPPRTGKVSYASVMDFVEDGDDMTKQAFHKMFAENDSYMESVLRFYPLEKVAKVLVPTKKEAGMALSIRIFTASSIPIGAPEEVKSQIATKGYCIQDSRLEEAKSKFGLVKYPELFTNPTDSGFYSYLTSSGNIRYGMIFTKLTKLNPHFATDEVIILDLKSGNSYREQIKDVFIRNKYDIKDYSDVHSKMIEIAEAQPSFDKEYILINEHLVASLPFRIRSNSKVDDVRVVEIETTGSMAPVGTSTSGRALKGNFNTKPDRFRTAKLILTKKPGDVPSVSGDVVFVPKGFKLLEVDFSFDLDRKDSWQEGRPGGLSALQGALAERRVFPMTVRSNGSEYFVNVGAAKRKYPNALKAKIALVTEVGLGEKEAEELVDSVLPMSKKEGYVKLAYTGDYTPQLQDPQYYSNELGQPTYDGVGYQETMPPDGQYAGNPQQIGLAEMPNIQGIEGSINQASQLAQSGQKQIFDTHSIATLAKYVSPNSKVQGYMPDFISCLDKLGRMLFLVYWETDKFEEMYGRSELPELVELITNVFKNLGDLVVFLKRKSPEISINMEKDELGS